MSRVRLGCRDRLRGEDQGEVAERLRKVPDLTSASHVVLLGEQPEIVRQAEQMRSNRLRASSTRPLLRERADQPEGAREELTFVAAKPSSVSGGRIARHEAVATKLARDRVDRAGDPLVGCREEPDERDVEDAGVELLGSVVLGEGAALRVIALLAAPRAWISSRTSLQRVDRGLQPEAARRPSRPGRTRPRP